MGVTSSQSYQEVSTCHEASVTENGASLDMVRLSSDIESNASHGGHSSHIVPPCGVERGVIADSVFSVASVLELGFCILVFILGDVIPDVVESYYHWEPPVPYQVAENGDVLLDLELSFDYTGHQTVPTLTRVILCIIIPLVTLTGVGLCFVSRRDAHSAVCVYLVASGCSFFLTNMVKFYVSRHRPNFYGMCGFDKDTLLCEADQAHVRNSHHSFPSGHASLAFSSMTTLSLYFLGKVNRNIHLSRNQGIEQPLLYPSLTRKILAMVACSPMLLAFFIAASRLHDFYHHPSDVLAGALIGGVCAFFAYGLWYPAICSAWSGYPLHTVYQIVTTNSNNLKITNGKQIPHSIC